MSYVPNFWLMSDLHRRIVSAARQLGEYSTLLRATRRHIFLRMFQLPGGSVVPEFFRPCFAVLAREKDPDKKPCLVIETEEPGAAIRQLYEQHGVLWAHVTQERNSFVLDCSHGGTSVRIEERTGSLLKLLSAPLAWSERNASFPQGSFVHSHSERVLRDAIIALSPSYRIEIHHQVPLSYVLGFKEDLSGDERRLLGSEIDAVITQSLDADPDGAVILPIKLDLHDSHRIDERIKRRDEQIRELCNRHRVPLVVVSPGPDHAFVFECPVLGLPNATADRHDPHSWASAIAPFLGAAIRYAGRSF